MTLGANETVTTGHFGVLGVNVHFLEIKYCQKIRNGQAAADMADTDAADALDNIAADILGNLLQITAQFNYPPQ